MEKNISPEILIIASENSSHVQKIQQHLVDILPNSSIYIFNLAKFPTKARCSILLNNTDFFVSITDTDANPNVESNIFFTNLHTIWWWEPLFPVIDSKITNLEQSAFAYLECCKLIESLWYVCECRWVNPPEALEIALNPLCQLYIAKSVGLKIPETMVSSYPDDLTKFYNEHQQEIWYRDFMPFSFPNKVSEQDRQQFHHLVFAPIIFQDIKIADFFAIIVIGDTINIAKKTQSSWEIEETNSIPQEIIAKIKLFMKKLRLYYGIIEMAADENNNFFFVALYPWGDFLRFENETSIPLTKIFADFLSKKE